MPIQHLQANTRIATRWLNGGGTTREIAASPTGATLGDFNWRVSMAEVTQPGPFSIFPNIDRIITILSGALTLTLNNTPVTLSPTSPPHAFPGDIPANAEPLNGPVTDLNVMTRRKTCTAQVIRVATGTLKIPQATTLFVALMPTQATLAATTHELALYDALQIETNETTLALNGAGLLITLR